MDRGLLDDPWAREEGDGIATRTATFIIGGEKLIEIFVEIGKELVPLLADDEAGTVELLRFNSILTRVSKEGVVLVETSAVRRFSSSSPLGPEPFIGVGIGMETGGERLVRFGVESELGTRVRGSA